MAEAGSGAAGGYVAFISYSHKDAAIGRWLHRKLEGYRLPPRLAGTEGEDGRVPARLTPIFRDRDELPAAGDLSEKVRAALAISRNLIVVCSPHSASSPWVAKEIATFRELHPGRPVFTAIVDGEPGQCFPPDLRNGGTEPLAADLRKQGDGPRLGLLKLVAGLAGVGLDALVQRDAARRIRRVTWVTAGAVTAVVVMTLLTAFALTSRAESERQRAEAEGLVEFMLTDLRDRLKGVGRLDVMKAVNMRALRYYDGRPRLSDDSRAQRAVIVQTMGEDRLARRDLEGAFEAYREALATTTELLARTPDHPRRLFEHTTNLAGLGQVHEARKEWEAARHYYSDFEATANRLVAMSPSNPDYLRKAAAAAINLGNIKLKADDDYASAEEYYRKAVSLYERAAKYGPESPHAAMAHAKALAWLGDSYFMRCEWGGARVARGKQIDILAPLHAADRNNADYLFHLAVANRGAGLALAKLGHRIAARQRLFEAERMTAELVRTDTANADWETLSGKLAKDFRTLGLGRPPDATWAQLRKRHEDAVGHELMPSTPALPACFTEKRL